jgi:hypothetical protein
MDVPTPGHALVAFATFVRARLAEVGGTFAPLITRTERVEVLPARARHDADGHAPADFTRQLASLIITAAGPFAPNSHARARLLRQAHASGMLRRAQIAGLLSEAEADRAIAAITAGR